MPGRLVRADLVVEWGLARRLTAARPRDLEVAWWAARFDLCPVRRIPARCFSPAPAVDAAHLSVRRRRGVDTRTQSILWQLLSEVHHRPGAPARHVLGDLVAHRFANRLLREHGTDPSTPAASVQVGQWAGLAAVLATNPAISAPPLPRALRG